ncbi:MAG: N-methylhydantoinase A [uncultured Thermomicrobiales bacterium]|uniref:N-methylhydantoinase A n=1 Tax=uncultured Thermomicrobiales bacterium TaxID=1645740 RepID=A0A6J4U1S4_9BACT|nr:MAG: N-methylhydantoinase A [uncultured Thermomicrobiales bacterium]
MKVGIDVGGTFTDLYAFASDGRTATSKTPSTPPDFADGVMAALEAAEIDLREVETVVHGSTVVTNAVIERRFPKVAFLTTEGFRDLVQIGRYHRPSLYDPYGRKPPPLIPRRFLFEVPERVGARGEVVRPLDEPSMHRIAAALRDADVTSVGIGFINAYANPGHERSAGDLLAEGLPTVPVTLSSEVSPKVGALARFTTTMLSTVLRPVVGPYAGGLADRLRARGFDGALWFVASSGGMMAAAEIHRRPEHLFVSGPAGGVQGAIEIGGAIGADYLIALDMGGTSCDVTIVEGGRPFVASGYEIDFDLPLAIPTIDIRTIGAGGGSIASVDAGGVLQVGPRSAGAVPGPACYARGGSEPTVTDADLLLGYLDPRRFLGGRMVLDRPAAEAAIGGLAERLGLDPVETALGVVRVVNEHMAAAVREVSVDRGRDPRDYALLPFGGAGPVHALAIAEIIGIPKVVVPPLPDVLSAFGATALDVTHDAEGTLYAELATAEAAAIEDRFLELEAQARRALLDQGVDPADCSVRRVSELRYVGQTYEVPVDTPADLAAVGAVAVLQERFHGEHASRYGVADPESPVAIVNLRVTAVGATPKPPSARPAAGTAPGAPARRPVLFPGRSWRDVPIHQRRDLSVGASIDGPAVIEQPGSTVVVPDGWTVRVDGFANLIADRATR